MRHIFAALASLLLFAGFTASSYGAPPLIFARRWQPPPILNQYSTPMCVGFATAAWLETWPHVVPNIPTPEEIYAAAQRAEGDPPGHAGTNVLPALDTLEWSHYIGAIAYANSASDVLAYLAKTGPVILWGPWLKGLSEPVNGRMRFSGAQNGQHAFLAYGVALNSAGGWDALIQNSYGAGWGLGGRGRLSAQNLQMFFNAGGGAAYADKLLWWTAFTALPH